MGKFIGRPVTAVQFVGDWNSACNITGLIGEGNIHEVELKDDKETVAFLAIKIGRIVKEVKMADWVALADGEHFIVPGSDFNKRYEPVNA